MNKMLKKSLLGTVIILFFFITIPLIGMAGEEVPPLPMTVQGIALIDGTPAPKGTVVAAYLNGEQVEEFLINTSSGNYCFWISGTGEDEGKPVTFTVDGKAPDNNLNWESGKQVLSLELSVGKATDSRSSKEGSTSNTGSGSLNGPETVGENSKTMIIEDSVPEPNVQVQTNINSGDKEASESPKDSSKLKSAPGFCITYVVAGILLIVFGPNFRRESRKKT